MIQLKCPHCGETMRPKLTGKAKYYEFNDERLQDAIQTYPKRRKECVKCGKRFNTREIYVPYEICKDKEKRKKYIKDIIINIPRG